MSGNVHQQKRQIRLCAGSSVLERLDENALQIQLHLKREPRSVSRFNPRSAREKQASLNVGTSNSALLSSNHDDFEPVLAREESNQRKRRNALRKTSRQHPLPSRLKKTYDTSVLESSLTGLAYVALHQSRSPATVNQRDALSKGKKNNSRVAKPAALPLQADGLLDLLEPSHRIKVVKENLKSVSQHESSLLLHCVDRCIEQPIGDFKETRRKWSPDTRESFLSACSNRLQGSTRQEGGTTISSADFRDVFTIDEERTCRLLSDAGFAEVVGAMPISPVTAESKSTSCEPCIILDALTADVVNSLVDKFRNCKLRDVSPIRIAPPTVIQGLNSMTQQPDVQDTLSNIKDSCLILSNPSLQLQESGATRRLDKRERSASCRDLSPILTPRNKRVDDQRTPQQSIIVIFGDEIGPSPQSYVTTIDADKQSVFPLNSFDHDCAAENVQIIQGNKISSGDLTSSASPFQTFDQNKEFGSTASKPSIFVPNVNKNKVGASCNGSGDKSQALAQQKLKSSSRRELSSVSGGISSPHVASVATHVSNVQIQNETKTRAARTRNPPARWNYDGSGHKNVLSRNPHLASIRPHAFKLDNCDLEEATTSLRQSACLNSLMACDSNHGELQSTSADNAKRRKEFVESHPLETSDSQTDPFCNDEYWSSKMFDNLVKAYSSTNPTSQAFWSEVADQVPGKSENECRSKWFSLVQTPAQRTKEKKATCLRRENCCSKDDIFDATPYREKSIATPIIKMSSTNEPVGSIIKIEKPEVSEKLFDTNLLNLVPLVGYKSFIQRFKRNLSRSKIAKDKEEKVRTITITRSMFEHGGDNSVRLDAQLTPGGTCTVKRVDSNDDNSINSECSEDDNPGDSSCHSDRVCILP
jgi:hypothetical protein